MSKSDTVQSAYTQQLPTGALCLYQAVLKSCRNRHQVGRMKRCHDCPSDRRMYSTVHALLETHTFALAWPDAPYQQWLCNIC